MYVGFVYFKEYDIGKVVRMVAKRVRIIFQKTALISVWWVSLPPRLLCAKFICEYDFMCMSIWISTQEFLHIKMQNLHSVFESKYLVKSTLTSPFGLDWISCRGVKSDFVILMKLKSPSIYGIYDKIDLRFVVLAPL